MAKEKRIGKEVTVQDSTKLPQQRFELAIRKKIAAAWVVKHWSRLLGDMVDDPGLSEFKRHLDNALNNFNFWLTLKWPSS